MSDRPIVLKALTLDGVAAEVEDQFLDVLREFLERAREEESANRSGDSVYVAKEGTLKLSGAVKFEIEFSLRNGGSSLSVQLEAKQPARSARSRSMSVDLHGEGFHIMPRADEGQDPLPFAERK